MKALFHSLTVSSSLVILAFNVLPGVSDSAHTVSLLFENDANWEAFGNHTSALLVYDAVSSSDAEGICRQEFNETLLSETGLSDVSNKLSYLKHLGQFNDNSEFWVTSSSKSNPTPIAIAPFSNSSSSSESSTLDLSKKLLPFLCTNSAPFTSQVDTNFSMSPKTNVISGGITFTGTRDHMTFRFMGVPYANPPLGPLRFGYPEPFNGSTRVDATAFQPACLQLGIFANNDLGINPWGISEDCLHLNVYTTYIPSSTSTSPEKLRPVLFWIHGGGNTSGTGNDATFDGGPLVTRGDVVLVTINHRLDIFGFLGLNDSSIPGNYAMADKIAALQWVQDHIAQFGGDRETVMIFGQSAGGASIVDLLKSPKAAGMFQRAISESGGVGLKLYLWCFGTLELMPDMVVPFLEPLCNGTTGGPELLRCLQALPEETLLNITNFATTWSTIIDGVYALAPAVQQMSLGPNAVNSVPFLLGFMPEEGQSLLNLTIAPDDANFTHDLITAVGAPVAKNVLESGLWKVTEDFTVYNATINAYTDSALTCPAESMIASASDSKAFPAMFVYTMQHAYALSFFDPYDLCTFPVGHLQPYYRCHSGDLYEVFGTYYIFDQPVRIQEDISHTALIQDLWTTFARTGNPNPDQADLAARGPAYASTLSILQETKWVWEEYDNVTMRRASLDYPDLGILEGLPDAADGKCAVVMQLV
ncbi:Alpha/Beta hydrolase protein [Rhodocollybia butyracea]|uniref:Alpha/Beta hydrolase protein n=1 Tax=Rhodocollybia butyracea TaxID=206335 RepID=A0A9P5PJL2_9AGAR|nr:Alpha/Beta hydrolase protein [Rhodocollybia butyracea]